MRAETAIKTAQFGGALLLSLALHMPAYLVLTHLRDASLRAPLRIEASVVMSDTRAVEGPQNAPVKPQGPAPPMVSTRITTLPLAPAPAPAAHVRPPEPSTQEHAASDAKASGGGVRARLLSSVEPEPNSAGLNDFVVAPPVAGDEKAPLPFAMPPGPGSPANPPEGAGGVGPPSAGGGEDPAVSTALTAYGRRLFERTMAQAHYPPQAIARGWQGKTLLLLRFGRRGALLDVAVRESSGYAVLDTEAIEMAKRAKTQLPIPDILKDRNFSLTIAVNFRLLDERADLPAPKTN